MSSRAAVVPAVALFVSLMGPSNAPAAVVERMSVDGSGREANAASTYPSLSADGRYVVFSSAASNLVPGDNNGVEDVFLHDRSLGTTVRISVGLGGIEADGASSLPTISPDGRYVGFVSAATNLVAGDTNGVLDAFLYDRQTGAMKCLSRNAAGVPGNDTSNRPVVSPDGAFWVFTSWASNLVPDDGNILADVFLYDVVHDSLTRVSVPPGGGDASSDSTNGVVSEGGRYVIFKSLASNLVPNDLNGFADIFSYDRQTSSFTRVSVGNGGEEADGESDRPAVSADGRYVAFMSNADNLVLGDTNGASDIFLRDTVLGTTVRVSVGDGGQEANGASAYPAISADGRYVQFSSSATNLVPGDTNGVDDIFLRDLQTGRTVRLSVDAGGAQGNGSSNGRAAFAADATQVAYASAADNLVAGDHNGAADIFVVDWSALAASIGCRTHDFDIGGCNAAGCAYYSCSDLCQLGGTPFPDAGGSCPGACRGYDGDPSSCGSVGCTYYACSSRCDVPLLTPEQVGCGSAPVVTVQANETAISEAAAAGTFTVLRTGPTDLPLTVSYAAEGTATNGVDYLPIPASVTIPAGSASATITIRPIDDHVYEGDETVTIGLEPQSTYSLGVPASATLTLLDNDVRPTVSIAVTDPIAIETPRPFPPNTGTFAVRRTGPVVAPLTVHFSVGGTATQGVDVVPLPTSIVIPAGARRALITVTPKDDALREPRETVTLHIEADPSYAVGHPATGTVIVLDNRGSGRLR